MSDLSKRFEELMVRMARTDAKLFRTLGEQHAALYSIAEKMQPGSRAIPPATLTGHERKPSIAAPLAAASLLPKEECSLKQLKKRFQKLAPALAFLEERLGAPQKSIGRFTWALVEQTVTTGHWPAGPPSSPHDGKPGSGAMAALEQRMERMEQRMERLEALLLQVLEQQSGSVMPPAN